MPKTKEIHILLDANIVLHYQRVDSIDWLNLVNAQQVILVICPVFFRELEQNKAHNPSKKLRKRAAQFISWIADAARAMKPYSIREGVFIKFIANDPEIDFSANNLIRSLSDDWLIASTIAYKNETSKNTVVATADLGLEIKLRNRGFDVVVLHEELLLPQEQDIEENELIKLRQEVKRLKALSPKLSLLFLNNLDRINITLLAKESLETFLHTEMMEIKKEHYKIPKPQDTKNTSNHPASLGSLITELSYFSGVIHNSATIEKYNHKLDNFYVEYGNYLRELYKLREKGKLSFEIELLLRNNGTAPASNIDIVIQFPEMIELIDFENISVPKKPIPPTRFSYNSLFPAHTYGDQWGLPDFQHITTLRDILNGKKVRGPILNPDKNMVTFWLANLKHNFDYSFDIFRIGFRNRELICNFSCDFKLFPDESPDPIEGKLHFIVDQSDQTSFE